jgi:eukaryotic-like serine/threonine-protein kinase
MKTERWSQIKQLYLAALEREKNERATFLAAACAGDEALRHEIESLLANRTEAESFLELPALNVATQVLADEPTQAKFPERIGAYRILKRLGAGGMGEVYLAQDARLGRQVALKLLPAAFTSDRESVWRFTQEARAASALNHPNIITIFEIGQTENTHFIATEFIDGQTLRQRLKAGNLSLLEALDILVQTGSALAAAHEAGIFHRDIKPENIMLRRDGYVKVLDFGLAKLAETQLSEFATQMAADGAMRTRSGVVMGTLAYMSPEQARGQKVDARTDIFSLGVVSYELLAGQRPFIGSTGAEIVAAVLHTEPPALTQMAPQLPSTLAAIVSKMLNKERTQRYQTINEVLAELKALKRQLEFQAELARSGEEAATKAQTHMETLMETAGGLAKDTQAHTAAHTTSASEVLLSELKRHKTGVALTMAALLLVLGGFGFWLFRLISQRQAPAPFQTMELARITFTGRAIEGAISSDGKYVAYTMDDDGNPSLWIKQTATSSNLKLLPSAPGVRYSNPTFSRDGNYLYFLKQEGGSARNVLYRIPSISGEARKLIEDVSTQDTRSNFGLSHDEQWVAFVRLDAQFTRRLMVMKLDGSGERVLATRQPTGKDAGFLSAAAFSPDDKIIAFIEGEFGRSAKLRAVNLADGATKLITPQTWVRVNSLAWLPDGSGLVVSAAPAFGAPQLWQVSYPSGTATRITNDLNGYTGVSLTADAATLITVQHNESAYLWCAPSADLQRATRVTAESGDYSQLNWTPDGRILYVSVVNGRSEICLINADGSGKKQLSVAAATYAAPSTSSDGRYLYFASDQSGTPTLWRMESDGSNPRQVLSNVYLPQCSPDGQWVIYYAKSAECPACLWKWPTAGGEPVRLTDKNAAAHPVVSPDNQWIACNYLVQEPNAQFRIAIISMAGGAPVKIFDVPGAAIRELRWTPDSRAITYLETRRGVSNIWAQPLDGSPPKPLTDFQSEYISSWNWSRDGKQLAYVRGPRNSDVVLINSFK